MCAIRFLCVVLTAFCVAFPFCDAAEVNCPLVPMPKHYREQGGTMRLFGPPATAIVVGGRAEAPERYAAERFRTLVERRFGVRLPIYVENAVPSTARQLFLLGQRSTHGWLDRLCNAHGIDLGPSSPGHDGFVIEVLRDGGREIVVIGGSNARGVMYGQDACFDLLRGGDGAVVLPRVSVRDWPSIAWRGRPSSRMRKHLEPGVLDAYVRSRLNFIDLRDAPGGRSAPFGFIAGMKIDEQTVKRILHEAHRRGFFVYGTVSCGVKPNRFDAVLRTFEQLVALGVDGLWISFDDPGPGKDAPVLIRRVLELGRRHGMTGRRIATTPPTGSYQRIETDFNRTAAKVEGFADATWFFTRVPRAADVAAARRIGLTRLPAWWHNWPRTAGGFLHDSYGGASLRKDNAPAYLDLPPLRIGWHSPRYERIRDAAQHTDTVMMWGGWPEEYTTAVLGIWAWNPKQHDWNRTRQAIYSYVFGPSQASAARAFDDNLAKLKALFELPVRRTRPKRGWPCRLKRVADRPKALALIDKLDTVLKVLESQSPKTTAIDPQRLQRLFLEPMRATVDTARKMATLEYPEYSIDVEKLEDELFELVNAGQRAAAERRLSETRARVMPQLDAIVAALTGLQGIDDYAATWRKRLSSLDQCVAAARKRRRRMEDRFRKLVQGDYRSLLAPIAQSLGEKPLAELPADGWLRSSPRWRGSWGIGLCKADGLSAVAIAYPGRTPSRTGDYAELRARIEVPKVDGALLLRLFVNDDKVDTRWTRYRFMQLWINDRLVWEEDIAARREGKEWITVDVSDLARGRDALSLRFRVVDKRRVSNYPTITFVGPVKIESKARR